MKRIILLTAVLLIAVIGTGCSSKSNVNKSTSTTPQNKSALHTMYVVGDIKDFDDKLAPLAKDIVKSDPNASWWLLGDSGYGEGKEVTDNYEEIAAVIPYESLHMVYGDHDYGTQNPKNFTEQNLENIGASRILNAQENFVYAVDSQKNLQEVLTPTDQSSEKLAWTITGTNDICVETAKIENTGCNNKRYDLFKSSLKENKKVSDCSIAMWHHPIYGVMKDGGNDQVGSSQYGTPLFESSIENGVDIVLNGDHHHFLATKNIDENGKLVSGNSTNAFTREFIVGTGGAPISADNKTPKLDKNAVDSDIRNQIGVLKIVLFEGRAELSFITVKGTQYSTEVTCK